MPGVPSLFTDLPTFSGVPFFFLDEMHCIAKNIGTLVYSLIDPGHFNKFKGDNESMYSDYLFAFKDNVDITTIMQDINNMIVAARPTIPTNFQGTWDKMPSFYRAIDFLDYLLYIIPSIVIPLLKFEDAKKALMDLVSGCSIALQWRITSRELTEMDK
jgi:hypothetical protein